jgi:plasmid stability protein
MGEILRMSENLIAVERFIPHEATHGHFLWRRTREIMTYAVSDGSSLGDLPGLIYQTLGQTLDGDNTRCTILISKTHPAFSEFAIRGLSMELDARKVQAQKEVRKSRHSRTNVK